MFLSKSPCPCGVAGKKAEEQISFILVNFPLKDRQLNDYHLLHLNFASTFIYLFPESMVDGGKSILCVDRAF